MSASFLMYVVVGSIGFGVDGGVMTALHTLLAWSPVAARAVSFPVAVSATWILNRHWTFGRDGIIAPRRRYGSYLVVQIIGALINLGVFVAVIKQSDLLVAYPIIALAIGAFPALVFTFTASKFLVFREAAS
ncbi:MAG: GtrA family protein [Alphaproteobacteria bacterium]|nr:GtrA family protein [Alphaproteobacteria bacterium]